jgi:MFS transporter, NRE family, putaive nickel resistance protein
MKQRFRWLQGLENPIFARLYLAQTINLIGDALTWLGLALLAFELVGEQAGTVLAGALTLRVLAFVVLSPLAGAIADRVDRKRLMIGTHLARMLIVCLLPFVTQVWQIYAIVLSLNVFYAFFAPTYTATIPLVTTETDRSQAIALSSATYQLLGVLGPGLAGSIAAVVGTRSVFFLDGLTFSIAAILLLMLPGQLLVTQHGQTARTVRQTLRDIRTGTTCLFLDPAIRYALVLQLIAAIAGAEILVNTVGYVRGTLHFGKIEYGWVMAAFGIGATLASIWLGNSQRKISPILLTSVGTVAIVLALLPANLTNLWGLLLLWSIAGVGQTLVNVPTQTLIADRVAVEFQGRVYGAHFAWSHLWWAFAYPLAGWMGTYVHAQNFFYTSLAGMGLLMLVYVTFKPQQLQDLPAGMWHEHAHTHEVLRSPAFARQGLSDDEHQHEHHHAIESAIPASHSHLHFHHNTSIGMH